MNKYKKLAIAAVSMVMAGTMAFSLAACGGGNKKKGQNVNPLDEADDWDVLNDETGDLNYSSYAREGEVVLNLGIGYSNAKTSTSFRDLGAEITMPDGVTYNDGDMKPAWVQMGKDLNITWNDVYREVGTDKNIETMTGTRDADGKTWYEKTDMYTTDISKAVSAAAGGTSILNLADYLNYMPNFSAFLKNNPIVYLSLLQDGMNTTTGEGKVIYVAPYFDGYDDIERYCIIRHDWAKTILNGSATLQNSTPWGKGTVVKSYFGATGYEIESLNSDGTKTQTIKKDYDAAKKAAGKEDNDLGRAYKAIAGETYGGDSGNIVDIMNAAIAKKNNVTGAELTTLYRAYIDEAYKVGNKPAYAADSRANLFIGYDAAWDADDLVAMLRCVVTNASALGASAVGGIAPRTGDMDRTPDMVSLAAQLYGARGGTSRYEYTYIDANGTLHDARNEQHFYEALYNLSLLQDEGLVVDFSNTKYSAASGYNGTTPNFMMYDYSQTQTLNGFYIEDPSVSRPSGFAVSANYDFEPILTPVAKWDTNSNGTYGEKGEIIRFTESWRSTKTGGLCLNGALADEGNEAKLKAALQFVDYLFHKDGQIVSTYGPMASNADGNGGMWYNPEASDQQVKDGKYFTYKGKKYYAEEPYKGVYTPTITQKVYDSFKDKPVNGFKLSDNESAVGGKLSFTGYARQLIGSTLPIGVKDQSFENQLTAKMGQRGANKVGVALSEDFEVVKGMTLNVEADNYWFTVVPSGLPHESTYQSILDSDTQYALRYLSGERREGQDKNMYSLFSWFILHGYDNSTYNYQDVTYTITSMDELINFVSTECGAKTRENAIKRGWETAKTYWEYLKPNK